MNLDMVTMSAASITVNGGLGIGEELLDLGDGPRIVLVVDRVDAYVTRTGHAYVGVVEEDHLPGRNVQAGADERVDAGKTGV